MGIECPFCDFLNASDPSRCDRCGGTFSYESFSLPKSEVSVVPGEGCLASPKQIYAQNKIFLYPRNLIAAHLSNEPDIVQNFSNELLMLFIAEVNKVDGILKPDEVWAGFSGPYQTDDDRFELIARKACGVMGLNSNYWWLPLVNMVGEISLSYAVAILFCMAKESKISRNWKFVKTAGAIALGGLLGWMTG